MVEVFKTDVPAIEESHLVIESLLQQCSDSEINFDLEDKDKASSGRRHARHAGGTR